MHLNSALWLVVLYFVFAGLALRSVVATRRSNVLASAFILAFWPLALLFRTYKEIRGPFPGRGRFKTGQKVPESGIYKVHHDLHRLPHEVTLLAGSPFPRCQKCLDVVEFEAQQLAPSGVAEQRGPILLYELPVLDTDDNQQSA